MRSIMMLVLATGLAISFGTAPAKSAEDVVAFYKQHALKDDYGLARCLELLKKGLGTGSLDHADDVMRRGNCFDDFSGLAGSSRAGTTYGYTPDGPVAHAELLEANVLALRITVFHVDLPRKLRDALSGFSRQQLLDVQTVLIDLVSDPGGQVSAAGTVLEAFSPRAGIVYLQEAASRCGGQRYRTTLDTGLLGNKRYIVLVNGGTASAAEWLTATLRYAWYPESTTVVGVKSSRTFGKALVQVVSADNMMKVTCGIWQIGDRSIQGSGIIADVVLTNASTCGRDYRCVMREVAPLLTTTIVYKR